MTYKYVNKDETNLSKFLNLTQIQTYYHIVVFISDEEFDTIFSKWLFYVVSDNFSLVEVAIFA